MGLTRRRLVTLLPVAATVGIVAGWMLSAAGGSATAPRPTPTAASTPAAAPATVVWQPVQLARQATWIPVSGDAGPAVTTAGQWAGWARTPAGAVQAAFTITAGFGLDNQQAHAYLRAHTVTTAAFLDEVLAARPADGRGDPATLRPTGFRLGSYSADQAAVDIVYEVSEAGRSRTQVLTSSLRWVRGDWRQVWLPSDHPSLSGPDPGVDYTAWGP